MSLKRSSYCTVHCDYITDGDGANALKFLYCIQTLFLSNINVEQARFQVRRAELEKREAQQRLKEERKAKLELKKHYDAVWEAMQVSQQTESESAHDQEVNFFLHFSRDFFCF